MDARIKEMNEKMDARHEKMHQNNGNNGKYCSKKYGISGA